MNRRGLLPGCPPTSQQWPVPRGGRFNTSSDGEPRLPVQPPNLPASSPTPIARRGRGTDPFGRNGDSGRRGWASPSSKHPGSPRTWTPASRHGRVLRSRPSRGNGAPRRRRCPNWSAPAPIKDQGEAWPQRTPPPRVKAIVDQIVKGEESAAGRTSWTNKHLNRSVFRRLNLRKGESGRDLRIRTIDDPQADRQKAPPRTRTRSVRAASRDRSVGCCLRRVMSITEGARRGCRENPGKWWRRPCPITS
jgi:hypothetical protein